MPYINFKTSLTLSPDKETELKAALGRAITAIPGKTEDYLMVEIEGGRHLWLGGDNSRPLVMAEVKIFGHAKPSDFSKMTGELCQCCESLLKVKPTDVYVTYAEVDNWGWNGKNF